jgi:hypothetical protein
MKYINNFRSKASKIYPNWYFWYENTPSGIPDLDSAFCPLFVGFRPKDNRAGRKQAFQFGSLLKVATLLFLGDSFFKKSERIEICGFQDVFFCFRNKKKLNWTSCLISSAKF